jgi:hypothetical protein
MLELKLRHAVMMLWLVATTVAAESPSAIEEGSIKVNAVSSGTEMVKEDLVASAKADGALLMQMSFCEKSKSRTSTRLFRKLLEKQERNSLASAKKQGIQFDAKTYRESLQAGMDVTFELMNVVPRSGTNYEKNCKEVKDKAKNKLGKP